MKYDFYKGFQKIEDFHDYCKEHDKYFEKEINKSNSLPDGLQNGKIIRTQVADGYAYYEIIKINKTTVRIKWRGDLCLDRWQDQILGSGGSFPKYIIENLAEQEEILKRIFGKK